MPNLMYADYPMKMEKRDASLEGFWALINKMGRNERELEEYKEYVIQERYPDYFIHRLFGFLENVLSRRKSGLFCAVLFPSLQFPKPLL